MSQIVLQFAVLVACCIGVSLSSSPVPKTWKLCSQDLPNISSCIKESVESLQKYLPSGNLGGDFKLTPFEPFFIQDIHISRGPEFDIILNGLTATGGSKFTIDKLRMNLKENTFDTIVSHPIINYQGKYKINVKLGILIKGEGEARGTLVNVKTRIKMITSRYMKEGQEYMKIDKINMRMKIGNITIQLDNLFNGDPALGQVGNEIIGQNAESFIADVQPVVEKTLSEKFLVAANDIFKLAPFDELFPKSNK